MVDVPEHLINQAGSILGKFLAHFHICSQCFETQGEFENLFANPNKNEVVFKEAVVPLKGILDNFGIKDAEELYNTVSSEFDDRIQEGSGALCVFSMGDLWPGSVLINFSENERMIGLIDWEFAGFASPTQDMGQFGDQLYTFVSDCSRFFTFCCLI